MRGIRIPVSVGPHPKDLPGIFAFHKCCLGIRLLKELSGVVPERPDLEQDDTLVFDIIADIYLVPHIFRRPGFVQVVFHQFNDVNCVDDIDCQGLNGLDKNVHLFDIKLTNQNH